MLRIGCAARSAISSNRPTGSLCQLLATQFGRILKDHGPEATCLSLDTVACSAEQGVDQAMHVVELLISLDTFEAFYRSSAPNLS